MREKSTESSQRPPLPRGGYGECSSSPCSKAGEHQYWREIPNHGLWILHLSSPMTAVFKERSVLMDIGKMR